MDCNNCDKIKKLEQHIADLKITTKCKLSRDDVFNIREMKRNGITYREISEKYGVRGSTIYSIIMRKTWRHVP